MLVYVHKSNKKCLMGNKNLVPWFVLMSFYSWKNLFMAHMYEAIKPSSHQEALKSREKLLKWVNYGKIFVEMCRKFTAAYIALY